MLNHDWSIWSVPKASKSHPFHPICIHLHDFDWFRMCGPVVICQSLESVFFMQFVDGSKLKILNLGESYQAQLENTTDKNQPFSWYPMATYGKLWQPRNLKNTRTTMHHIHCHRINVLCFSFELKSISVIATAGTSQGHATAPSPHGWELPGMKAFWDGGSPDANRTFWNLDNFSSRGWPMNPRLM